MFSNFLLSFFFLVYLLGTCKCLSLRVFNRHKSYTLYTILLCISYASFLLFHIYFCLFSFYFQYFCSKEAKRVIWWIFEGIKVNWSKGEQNAQLELQQAVRQCIHPLRLNVYDPNQLQMDSYLVQNLKEPSRHSTKKRKLGSPCN